MGGEEKLAKFPINTMNAFNIREKTFKNDTIQILYIFPSSKEQTEKGCF